MKKLLLSVFLFTVLSFCAKTQIVNIPDTNFKAYLLGNSAINTNSDTEIQVSEANAFTGTISCSNLSISDLSGIEAFTALTNLSCFSNSLTSLDVTQNTLLTHLVCYANLLTSLDVSQNTVLDNLSFQSNSITSIDVSQNTALRQFHSNDNPLTSIDLSQNNILTNFSCLNNQLTYLNLANGNNINMSETIFDATGNPNLTCIQVDDVIHSDTSWTSIDAVASFKLNCTNTVGVNEIKENIISIYPNPVFNQLSIINNELSILKIDIIDVMGKTIKTITENTNSIDVSELTKGTYFIKIQTTKRQINKRLVKM